MSARTVERHHLVLRLAAALERAFPVIRFFGVAAQQVSYLVEVAADDTAVRRPAADPRRGAPGRWRPPGSRPARSGRAAAPAAAAHQDA